MRLIDLGNLSILPEVAEHETVEFVLPAPRDGMLELQIDNRPLEAFLLPGDALWHWRWNAGMAVGVRQAVLHTWLQGVEGDQRVFAVRVVPRKIDQERYELLLDDLERLVPGLARALGGTALEGATLQRPDGAQSQQLDALIGMVVTATERLERATGQIMRRPHTVSRPVQRQTTIGESRRPGTARGVHGSLYTALPQVRTAGDEALLVPHDVIEERSSSSLDTYEHRLLKRLLDVLLQRARLAGRMAARRAPTLLGECEAAVHTLRALRALPFFEQVGPLAAFRGPSHLIQRSSPYREIYQVWHMVRGDAALSIDSPLFYLAIEDLPQLYECWCVLQVVQAVLAIGLHVREQRLVHVDGDGSQLTTSVRLNDEHALLEGVFGDLQLRVRYQARYRAGAGAGEQLGSLDNHMRVPDVVVELQRDDRMAVVVLDAKYRLDATGMTVPPDALADAYAYHGAIGYRGRPASCGVLLLYPGASTPEWYSSGVGALALLPGTDTEHLTHWLRERLLHAL